MARADRGQAVTIVCPHCRHQGDSAAFVDGCQRCGRIVDFPSLDGSLQAANAALTEHVRPVAMATDLGNAERFVRDHDRDALYCVGLGWLVWDGQRYAVDDTLSAMRLAKTTVRRIYAEAARVTDESQRKSLASHAKASESVGRIRAMLELARSLVPVRLAELDADPWALNCHNGTVDLRTGELRRHDRDDRCTRLAGAEYDPAADSPLWIDFLHTIFSDDAELIGFAQRAVGYAATGVIREHVVNVLWGAGANGKSTFLDAIGFALGDYGGPGAPGLLMARRGDAHPTERMDLRGKRFVWCVETSEGGRLNEELLKLLSGGDRIKARGMRENFVEFPPTHKLFVSTNHKPVVKGTDTGIWRRLQLWPFIAAIPLERQDTAMLDKLKAEAPAILKWIVDGCIRWQRERLNPPECVQAAVADYRAEMDVLGAWIKQRCITDQPTVTTKAGELYASYKNWAEAAGERPVSQRAFGLALKERGLEHGEPDRGRTTWRGIALVSEEDEDLVDQLSGLRDV